MTIHFETIIFPTFLPPPLDLQKKRGKHIIIPVVALLLLYLSLFSFSYSVWLGLLIASTSIGLYVYLFRTTTKTFHIFISNGTLTIDRTGFHINQDNKYFIPFEHIRSTKYEMDRKSSVFSTRTSLPKTYKLTILGTGGEQHVIYPDRQPVLGKRRIYGDFNEVMEALRRTDHHLYRMIRYVE